MLEHLESFFLFGVKYEIFNTFLYLAKKKTFMTAITI